MDISVAVVLLMVFCAQHTGGVLSGSARYERSTESSEAHYYNSILCTPTPAPLAPSLSVHALLPGDISSVYTLGAPSSHRNEALRVVARVTELLSMFNPDVNGPKVKDSLEHKILLEEVEEISQHLPQEPHWKFVLLLVPVNSLCPCSAHVTDQVSAVVQEVEEALLLMENKLPRSLVHVAVWSSPGQLHSSCECLGNENINRQLHQAILIKTLQDSLESLVEDSQWHSDEFSVFVQPVPVITESGNSVSDVNNIAIQLWTHMVRNVPFPLMHIHLKGYTISVTLHSSKNSLGPEAV